MIQKQIEKQNTKQKTQKTQINIQRIYSKVQ